MGTLTGNQTRLPGQCEHKLATSCRLTSIPNCCACADERAHTASYSTYVDGVGFVPWGKRWQRYCWYCREFWEKRVEVSGMRPAQTKVPEVPDQKEFLDRWNEFHRGYRAVTKEDGSEERIAVLGEDWREVDPGCLPRTLEEMRAGRVAAEGVTHRPHVETSEQATSGQTLEDTLDQMFREAESEDTPASPLAQSTVSATQRPRTFDPLSDVYFPPSGPRRNLVGQRNNIHAQAMTPAVNRNREYQARRIAALRRELHRMRNGIERVISGLRDLGEAVPEHAEATNRLAALGGTLDEIGGVPSQEDADLAIRSVNALAENAAASQTDRTMASIQARVDEARLHFDEARRNRDQAASELDVAEQEFRTSQQRLQQLQREQRTTENYLRLFGTREEMLEQGDQYESPIGGMFSRAYQRFHAAEEVRRDERTLRRVLEDEARAGGEDDARRLAELEGRERDVWGVPLPRQTRGSADVEDRDPEQEPVGELEEYYALLRRQNWNQVPPVEPVQLALSSLQTESGGGGPAMETQALSTTAEGGLRSNDDFPRNMLNGVAPARAQEASESMDYDSADPVEVWRDEARHLFQYLDHNREHLEHIANTADDLARMYGHFSAGTSINEVHLFVQTLLDTPAIVWASRLMPMRFRRRRRLGIPVGIRMYIPEADTPRWLEQTEVMAEAFQMSSEVRQRAPALMGPERLSMLYRLQAGERTLHDVEVLQRMCRDRDTLSIAARRHADLANTADRAQEDGRRSLDQQRRDAARSGNHSRQELDAQRQATRAFAVAAGRAAMQTGPNALLEQMTSHDAETQAAYERLRENGWVPDGDTNDERQLRRTVYRPFGADAYVSISDSETEPEGEDNEPQGLDDPDAGRPEPKSDEEMKVSMECRICYTQLAEIACLPCGHLVMCKWCSDKHSPVMAHDHTRPRRAAGCPVCRKGFRQKVRVFRA